MSTPHPAEPGPLGDEAAKLLAAAQQWFQRTLGDSGGHPLSTGAPECAWCPLCQLIRTLRGEHGELGAKLTEVQSALTGLMRAVADAAGVAGQAGDAEPARSRIHRIDLDDDLRDPHGRS